MHGRCPRFTLVVFVTIWDNLCIVEHEHPSHEPQSDPLNIRPDVIRMYRDRPFVTFEEVYDQLKEIDAVRILSLLDDANRYSDDVEKKHAFAMGILHVLAVQLASREFDALEASLRLSLLTDDDGDVDQPRSDEPDDDQPVG